MDPKEYPVAFEIAGPAAMFTRPDTGSSPVSYPAPTKSALKSMFNAVVFSPDTWFEPTLVKICLPITFHKYSTNYRGPLKESNKTNFQIFATVLENVRYQVFGRIEALPAQNPGGINRRHWMQEMFLRKLNRGEFYSTPFLGWKEFTPSYFGPCLSGTTADRSINLTIPSMLLEMYDSPVCGRIAPRFIQNVSIKAGELQYAQ